MSTKSKLAALLDLAKKRESYWVEKAKIGFAVALERRRKAANVSNAQLAEKLGTSPAYISKVFRGDTNFTIETMVKLARATGGTLQLEITDDVVQSAPVFVLNNYRKPSVTHQAESVVVSEPGQCANFVEWNHLELKAAA